MSRNYDNWAKLVGAVLRREKDRQLAFSESFSSSSSAGISSRFSFDSAVDVDFTPRLSFDHFVGDVNAPAVSRIDGVKFDPVEFHSFVFRDRDVKYIVYEEIKKATKNFNPGMYLGGGGFGPVYKGWVHEHHFRAMKPGSGMAIAARKLNKKGLQGHNKWVYEIQYMSQLCHPNIVKLLGYSFDRDDNRIVVYEFVPKGSLVNHLFKRKQSLPWATRIKVALGAARAVAFLHNLETPVIHRNIKCSNILLDGDFQAKLSDFGLAIDGPSGDMTHVEALVYGTYGFADPEYIATGKLTTSSDVYGFGVVLLELISGLRAIDRNRADGKDHLVDWGKPYLKDKKGLPRFIDSKLEGQYPPEEAYKVAQIALKCASSEARFRPRMTEVVAQLEKL